MTTTIDKNTRWQESKHLIDKLGMQSKDVPDSVNPFYTSDDYRITVSGNISLSVNGSMYENKFKETN